MKNKFFKEIEGQTIKLREFMRKDCNDLHEILCNYNVCRYLILDPIETKIETKFYLEKIINEYEEKGPYKIAIVEKNTNKVVGYVGLSKQELTINKCQVVYATNEAFWNHGYTSEALKMFINYLINVEKREYIIARHVKQNIYSGKVMEKAGFYRQKNLDMEMIIHGNKEKLIGYEYRR